MEQLIMVMAIACIIAALLLGITLYARGSMPLSFDQAKTSLSGTSLKNH